MSLLYWNGAASEQFQSPTQNEAPEEQFFLGIAVFSGPACRHSPPPQCLLPGWDNCVATLLANEYMITELILVSWEIALGGLLLTSFSAVVRRSPTKH